MKKQTKALVVAASVAAIAGIGAVSFAAWSGNTRKQVISDTIKTGSIALLGFVDENPSITLENAVIVPWDQGENDTPAGNAGSVKVISVTLPKVEATQNFWYVVTTSGDVQGSFYANISNTTYTDSTVVDPTSTEGWVAIPTSGNTCYFAQTVDAADTRKEFTDTLNIVLDSTDSADMSKDKISFTVTLTTTDPTPQMVDPGQDEPTPFS